MEEEPRLREKQLAMEEEPWQREGKLKKEKKHGRKRNIEKNNYPEKGKIGKWKRTLEQRET